MVKALIASMLLFFAAEAAAAQTSKYGIPSSSGAGGVQILMSTVAQLPNCDVSHIGMLRGVTDASSSSYGATLAGGGTVTTLAMCTGTVWTQR